MRNILKLSAILVCAASLTGCAMDSEGYGYPPVTVSGGGAASHMHYGGAPSWVSAFAHHPGWFGGGPSTSVSGGGAASHMHYGPQGGSAASHMHYGHRRRPPITVNGGGAASHMHYGHGGSAASHMHYGQSNNNFFGLASR